MVLPMKSQADDAINQKRTELETQLNNLQAALLEDKSGDIDLLPTIFNTGEQLEAFNNTVGSLTEEINDLVTYFVNEGYSTLNEEELSRLREYIVKSIEEMDPNYQPSEEAILAFRFDYKIICDIIRLNVEKAQRAFNNQRVEIAKLTGDRNFTEIKRIHESLQAKGKEDLDRLNELSAKFEELEKQGITLSFTLQELAQTVITLTQGEVHKKARAKVEVTPTVVPSSEKIVEAPSFGIEFGQRAVVEVIKIDPKTGLFIHSNLLEAILQVIDNDFLQSEEYRLKQEEYNFKFKNNYAVNKSRVFVALEESIGIGKNSDLTMKAIIERVIEAKKTEVQTMLEEGQDFGKAWEEFEKTSEYAMYDMIFEQFPDLTYSEFYACALNRFDEKKRYGYTNIYEIADALGMEVDDNYHKFIDDVNEQLALLYGTEELKLGKDVRIGTTGFQVTQELGDLIINIIKSRGTKELAQNLSDELVKKKP